MDIFIGFAGVSVWTWMDVEQNREANKELQAQ